MQTVSDLFAGDLELKVTKNLEDSKKVKVTRKSESILS